MIRVVNDVIPRTTPKNFWQELADSLGAERHDFASTGATCWNGLRDLCHALPAPDLGIQNATWAPPQCAGRAPYIALLQDNIVRMWNDPVPQQPTLANATAIVANGRLIATDYAEHDRPRKKIHVIPLPVDLTFFTPDSERRRSLVNRKPRAIFVGDCSTVKGWEHVRALAQGRRDLEWVFVSKNVVDPQIHAMQLGVVVQRANPSEVRTLLRAADVFVLGSPVETQCLAALEAMACGLPVVMPATGAFWDWRPESFFEAAVWSYPHFSAALDRALSEVDRCSPRTDLIQARVFTPANCMNAWCDLVRQVLEEHPR